MRIGNNLIFNIKEPVLDSSTNAVISPAQFKKIFVIEKGESATPIRRDVKIKKILRAFRKFIKEHLSLRVLAKKNCKESSQSIKEELLKNVSKVCLNKGILKSPSKVDEFHGEDLIEFNKSITELLAWMVTPRHYDHKYSIFVDSKNQALCSMRSLMESYSHSKLKEFFSHPVVNHLFQIFLDEFKHRLLGSLPKTKKDLYEQVINDIELNMLSH